MFGLSFAGWNAVVSFVLTVARPVRRLLRPHAGAAGERGCPHLISHRDLIS